MSSEATRAAPAANSGGGAFGLRPRGRLLTAGVALVAAVVVAVVLLVGHGGGGHTRAAVNAAKTDKTYGGYPKWLPHTKLPAANHVLQSTSTHRQLQAVEGNPVNAHLPGGGEAEITAVGPSFPEWVSAKAQAGTLAEGSPVPTTFSVTVIARHGTVPLRATAFSILTAGGQLLHPAVTTAGGAAVPPSVRAGHHVNLTLRSKLVEGDGSVRWAPTGSRVMAGWIYQLELD